MHINIYKIYLRKDNSSARACAPLTFRLGRAESRDLRHSYSQRGTRLRIIPVLPIIPNRAAIAIISTVLLEGTKSSASKHPRD